VKPAGWSSPVARAQGDREAPSGAERNPIVGGGIRQLRVSVGVEETGDERPERRRPERRWITAREQSDPERGTRFLRGEDSEGGEPRRLRHETRPQSLGLLGNRCEVQPESGTEVGKDSQPPKGLARGIPSRSEEPRELVRPPGSDGRAKVRSFKREQLQKRMTLCREVKVTGRREGRWTRHRIRRLAAAA